MTWFKVDDTLAFHAKVVAAGNAAMGLWVRAGAWAAQQLTDGFIPDHMVRSLGTPRQAAALVAAGLWVEAEAGFRFHEWNDDERQPTRQEVDDKRKAWREKKRQQRAHGTSKSGRDQQGRFSVPGGHVDVSPGESPGVSPLSRPVPSRPITTGGLESAGSYEDEAFAHDDRDSFPTPVRSLDERWKPSERCRRVAATNGLDMKGERERFTAHARANGRTVADWDAAFEGWLLDSAKRTKTGAKTTTDDKVRDGLELARRLAAVPNDLPQIGA